MMYWIGRTYLNYVRYERTRKEFGCPPLKRYPNWDPILGLDYVAAMFKAPKEHWFFQFQKEAYHSSGSKCWTAIFMGNRMVYSAEPENIKAMSISHADSFAVEPIRVGNGAITPFQDRGVSSSDGAHWQYSRNLVKPYFDRAGSSNLGCLSRHVYRLLSKIPTDGSTVDMQPLFQRWISTLFEKKLLCLFNAAKLCFIQLDRVSMVTVGWKIVSRYVNRSSFRRNSELPRQSRT